MHFATSNAHTTPLFYNSRILKFADIIHTESCVFINNCFNKDSFSIFADSYSLSSATHSHNTRSSSKGLLFIPSYNTSRFGRKSVIHSTTLFWNHIQKKFNEHNFLEHSAKHLKKLLTDHFISNYDEQ